MKWLAQGHRTNQWDIWEGTGRFRLRLIFFSLTRNHWCVSFELEDPGRDFQCLGGPHLVHSRHTTAPECMLKGRVNFQSQNSWSVNSNSFSHSFPLCVACGKVLWSMLIRCWGRFHFCTKEFDVWEAFVLLKRDFHLPYYRILIKDLCSSWSLLLCWRVLDNYVAASPYKFGYSF